MSAKSILFLFAYLFMVSLYGSVSAKHVSEARDFDITQPPQKPEKFATKQELKDYMVKLHDYYAVIGRPRFGRSFPMYEKQLSSAEELNTAELNIPVSLVMEIMAKNNDAYRKVYKY